MSKGLVRAVDKMGRVVIPKEYRKELGIENEIDSFEITRDGDKIILKKYRPFCFFCGRLESCVKIGEYTVCTNCIDRLNKARDNIK